MEADHEGPEPNDQISLTFPDQPRLELDQLLGQLVERAQEVMSTQGRLRGLLHANQLVGSELALPVVLRRVAEVARDLLGARYAALGVIAPDGHLAEFVHAGVAPDAVERIGRLPQGKGLLGALIEDPHPIRLAQLSTDARAAGFPEGHPPMESFLGVPIRVRDEVFGNLYLAESTRGAFSADDEELARALAATTGVAIDNARHYASARSRQRWLEATVAITRRLLSAEPGDPLRFIAERTRELAEADVVTVLVPVADGPDLRVAIAVGADAEELVDRPVPVVGSLAGRVYSTREPTRSARPADGQWRAWPSDVEGGPVMVVPLVGSDRVHGVLAVVRLAGGATFTADDVDMAAGFASQASVAIELGEARAERQSGDVLDERDRIATELHDHVIQRLFTAGMTLHGIAANLERAPAELVRHVVDGLDETIARIRATIFDVATARGGGDDVRRRLQEVIIEATRQADPAPAVEVTGSFEALPDDVVDDLVVVVRGAIARVVGDANGRPASVVLAATPDLLTVEVHGAGRGGAAEADEALAHLRRTAELHNGTFDIAAAVPYGVRLTWTVPISRPAMP